MEVRFRDRWRLVAVSLLLAVFAGVVSSGNTVRLVGIAAHDDAVDVTVRNTAGTAKSVTVNVRAIVGGRAATAVSQASLGGNRSTVVSVHFGGPVDSVLAVGIIEGPDPIPQ